MRVSNLWIYNEGKLISDFSMGADDPWIKTMEKDPNQPDPDNLLTILRVYEESYQGKITGDFQ